MKSRVILAVCVASVAAGTAAAFALTSKAGASGSPFASIPAVGNIAALNATPLVATPDAVQRLGSDLQPAAGQTHQLGNAAYAWTENGSVCVLMIDRGPGGCFSEFQKPVVLFLWGDSNGFNAGGIVPDSITQVTLITSNGDVPVSISGNSFEVSLPANTTISGERVTSSNGQTFVNNDSVSLPHV